MLTRRVGWFVAAAVAAVAIGGGGGGAAVALADTGSGSTNYVGCIGVAGVLYNVQASPASAPKCFGHDQTASWNSTGPQGPAGEPGPAGPTGASGPQGPAGPDLKGTVYGAQEWVGSAQLTPGQGLMVEHCPSGQVGIAGSAWLYPSARARAAYPSRWLLRSRRQMFTDNAEIYAGQYAGVSGTVGWNLTCAYVSGVVHAP